MAYLYGMKMRGFSIGCQPMKGLSERLDDRTGKYWDILRYNRQLSPEEVRAYELEYIGETVDKTAEFMI
jgi:hypothetical protein